MLFSITAAPFYLPTSSTQGFQFLHILTWFLFVLFCFKIWSILIRDYKSIMTVFIKLEKVFTSLILLEIETSVKYQIQLTLLNIFNIEGVTSGFYNCFYTSR